MLGEPSQFSPIGKKKQTTDQISYCASPISGMGTTLAMSGAYNLAGAILQHPDDIATAFDQYETAMRPVVERAQKLPPGMPHLIHPETAWGVQVMHMIVYFMCQLTPVISLLFKFGVIGPPAKLVPVEEYGYRQLDELTDAEPKA